MTPNKLAALIMDRAEDALVHGKALSHYAIANTIADALRCKIDDDILDLDALVQGRQVGKGELRDMVFKSDGAEVARQALYGATFSSLESAHKGLEIEGNDRYVYSNAARKLTDAVRDNDKNVGRMQIYRKIRHHREPDGAIRLVVAHNGITYEERLHPVKFGSDEWWEAMSAKYDDIDSAKIRNEADPRFFSSTHKAGAHLGMNEIDLDRYNRHVADLVNSGVAKSVSEIEHKLLSTKLPDNTGRRTLELRVNGGWVRTLFIT